MACGTTNPELGTAPGTTDATPISSRPTELLPTTVPESSSSGPETTAQPEFAISAGWSEYDPGDGYTIALPSSWVDVTAVIKGEMDPSDIPAFENAWVSVEEVQRALGSDLKHLSFIALETESESGINIVQRPNSTELSAQEAQTQLESRPDVPNSSVVTVDGLDVVRFDFTIQSESVEYARVELAVIEPDTLTFISFSGPEGDNDLQQILKTMNFS